MEGEGGVKCTRKELALAKELAEVGWNSLNKELGRSTFEWSKLHKLARRSWIIVARHVLTRTRAAFKCA
jgi:hypothetical protein